MKISHIQIKNFRGIASGELYFGDHTVMVGDNNSGKSTVLEAIDLVLGPDRLSRRPIIDEHDFYAGQYLDATGNAKEIKIEVLIADLSDEQLRHFNAHINWWNEKERTLLDGPPPESTDSEGFEPVLRVGFRGNYDAEEDDFAGSTYFLAPEPESGIFDAFRTLDKRKCGFLYLRTLRTGSRALSLEHGSLLDIILRLQDKKQLMWEEVLGVLRGLSVAEGQELGIGDILQSVQDSIRSYVPSDWGDQPRLRVTDLTRENLRRAITVFMSTGAIREDGTEYSAPFQHQGTGTINTIVLALLSMIADLKQNVIFAMEEPEIAIPPYTQKRIINSVRTRSSQALFTSHSPYVLEEFAPAEVLVIKREAGILSGSTAEYLPAIKAKDYRKEFRLRICEALLAKRVLITEGKTEYDAYSAAARRLYELEPENFKSFEALGIAIVDAYTDSQVGPLGQYFTNLGKLVFAVFDRQQTAQKQVIEAGVAYCFEAPEHGFEKVLINGISESVLRKHGLELVAENRWPTHLGQTTSKPSVDLPLEDLQKSMLKYLEWGKGDGLAADLLARSTRSEMPSFIVDTLLAIQSIVDTKANAKPQENDGDATNLAL